MGVTALSVAVKIKQITGGKLHVGGVEFKSLRHFVDGDLAARLHAVFERTGHICLALSHCRGDTAKALHLDNALVVRGIVAPAGGGAAVDIAVKVDRFPNAELDLFTVIKRQRCRLGTDPELTNGGKPVFCHADDRRVAWRMRSDGSAVVHGQNVIIEAAERIARRVGFHRKGKGFVDAHFQARIVQTQVRRLRRICHILTRVCCAGRFRDFRRFRDLGRICRGLRRFRDWLCHRRSGNSCS